MEFRRETFCRYQKDLRNGPEVVGFVMKFTTEWDSKRVVSIYTIIKED